MEQPKSINRFTIIMALVAGFCDTLTFVSGHSIFSAHVTGNFIVFAAQVVSGAGVSDYLKLLTFPVFIIAVIMGGRLIDRGRPILLMEGIILVIAGLLPVFISTDRFSADRIIYTQVMLTVFAMGLQNAFGKINANTTYGPTTMMTGNVTQAALSLGNLILGKKEDHLPAIDTLRKISINICSFLTGCLLAAIAAHYIGLKGLIIPGIGIVVCYLMQRETSE